MVSRFRQLLRNELEAPEEERPFGSGWLSGVAALILSVGGGALQVCMLFPGMLTIPQLRATYNAIPFHIVLYTILIAAFGLAMVSLVLRASKLLGFTAIMLVLITTLLGNFIAPDDNTAHGIFFGLDWFMLNILFTGALFIPVERLFPRRAEHGLFRLEWREDLFYYFISSLMVQVLTFLSLLPSNEILTHTRWQDFRGMIGGQPLLLQFIEIMVLTDLVQYWVHRSFHRIPALWNFHAVHHSARILDWMAGARMHVIEIVCLRGITVIPMMVMGYAQGAVHAYILTVYIYATLIHANINWSPARLSGILVTPRYHHWHHGIEKEAIDVNFAIHFPLFDRLFGTYYMPEDIWPRGYGIGNHPVPSGYIPQLLYPLRRK